jgi:hypothetical protein
VPQSRDPPADHWLTNLMIGAGLGKSIRNFKRGVAEVEKEEPEKIDAVNNP